MVWPRMTSRTMASKDKRIRELEEQLAEATNVLKYTSTAMVEAEKREAALREALEDIMNLRGDLKDTHQGNVFNRIWERARAALKEG